MSIQLGLAPQRKSGEFPMAALAELGTRRCSWLWPQLQPKPSPCMGLLSKLAPTPASSRYGHGKLNELMLIKCFQIIG